MRGGALLLAIALVAQGCTLPPPSKAIDEGVAKLASSANRNRAQRAKLGHWAVDYILDRRASEAAAAGGGALSLDFVRMLLRISRAQHDKVRALDAAEVRRINGVARDIGVLIEDYREQAEATPQADDLQVLEAEAKRVAGEYVKLRQAEKAEARRLDLERKAEEARRAEEGSE